MARHNPMRPDLTDLCFSGGRSLTTRNRVYWLAGKPPDELKFVVYANIFGTVDFSDCNLFTSDNGFLTVLLIG